MKSLHTFTVVIVADCTKQEAASYVRDAIRSWGGHSLFGQRADFWSAIVPPVD